MKKIIVINLLCIALFTNTQAQKKTATEKVVQASEKVNNKSKEISEASNKVAEQANQAGQNAKNIAANVKAVIKVFEPILKHFKKRKATTTSNTDVAASKNNVPEIINPGGVKDETAKPPLPVNTEAQFAEIKNDRNYEAGTDGFGVPENENYNSDGTANWGNQNNRFPNLLDAYNGEVKDAYQAELNPASIDLIFLADQYGGYMLASPVFLKNSDPGFHYENVVKEWTDVNESEVALTRLTIGEFEKIKVTDLPRFYSVVKQTKGYVSFYQTFDEKLKGKVFAIRSEMGDRKAYALIAVIDQIGTYGSSGRLIIKIKATGIDNDGDGNPDEAEFQRGQ